MSRWSSRPSKVLRTLLSMSKDIERLRDEAIANGHGDSWDDLVRPRALQRIAEIEEELTRRGEEPTSRG